MKSQNNIIFWLLILLLAIGFTGLVIYFTDKKIASDKAKVETYIIYNINYAYYYDNKTWHKVTDVSFIPEKDYTIYNGHESMGIFSATINNHSHKINYSNEDSTYNDLIGINSNKTIPFEGYDIIETITGEDLSYVKQYLISKSASYIDGITEIKMIRLDIDDDTILEKVFEIYSKSGINCYNYIIIKDGDNTEAVVSYAASESDINYKRYSVNLIIDADLNQKKEILIVEDGYEYSNLLLYANQYGTYSLVE